MNLRDGVHSLDDVPSEGWEHGADIGVAPDVGDEIDVHPGDDPVRVEPHLGVEGHRSAMHHRHHVLAAVLGPLDRATELLGQKRRDGVFGIETSLRPKTAAHGLRCGDPKSWHVDADEPSEAARDGLWILAGDPHHHLVAVRDRKAAVRLDRNASETLAFDLQFDNVCRSVTRRTFVADLHVETHVVVRVGKQLLRGVRKRVFHVYDNGKVVDIDDDRLGRVSGLAPGLGDDRGDDVANHADAFAGEHRSVERTGRAIGKGDLGEVGVRRGVHTDNARHPLGLSDVDLAYGSMGNIRANVVHVHHALSAQVIEVLLGSMEQRWVFPSEYCVSKD